MVFDDPELSPIILPVDALLSLTGRSATLRGIVDRLANVVPQKERVPNTSNISLEALDSRIVFKATDGTQTLVIADESVRVNREGVALIPGYKLKQIIALVPDEETTITIFAEQATITSGRAVWTVAIPVGRKLPPTPDHSTIEKYTVPRRDLYRGIHAVKRALPVSGSRKSLEQIQVFNGAVTASDGYRLFRASVEGMEKRLKFSIPDYSVEELLRTLSAGTGELRLGASQTAIVIEDGLTTLITAQQTVGFPDVEPLVVGPALENKIELDVDTDELKALVKRIRVSADPEYFAVTLQASQKAGDWSLKVSTRDRSSNAATETMFADVAHAEESFAVSVNHKHLMDLLESYGKKRAVLRIGLSETKRKPPVLVRDTESGFVGVIPQAQAR